MVIQIFDNEKQVAQAGAALIATQLLDVPESVLGFATGSTPLGIYSELTRLYEEGVISFATARTFNLDEYYGLAREHEQSYFRFMHENLFNHVNLKPENIHLPNGEAEDADEECRLYEDAIREAGGVDLQLLGIGHNGHIGFNEPGSFFPKATHKVRLTDDTIHMNARFFASEEEVPREALSMGIGTIMDAEKILVVATGANKADAVYEMVAGQIDPQCPASILQVHPRVTLLLDREAAARLDEATELFG